jgi:competence protein ComEC
MERHVDGRVWRVLATRSLYLVPPNELISLCRHADVVVSERRLPRRCRGRWLTLDRTTLARTGGVRVTFATGSVATVRAAGDAHPWVIAGQHQARKAATGSRMFAGRLSMLPAVGSNATQP